MADPQTKFLVYDHHPDHEEPEDEDARRNSLTSGERSALIVKPPPLRLEVAADAGTSMQHPTNTELVYPWLATNSDTVSVITESAMMMPTTLYATAVRSEPGPRVREDVTTALLAGSPQTSKNDVRCCVVDPPLGYGTNVSMQRRHSILRMSASKTSSAHGLRKSASVEFVLDHAHQQAAQSIHASTSSIGREPRCVAREF